MAAGRGRKPPKGIHSHRVEVQVPDNGEFHVCQLQGLGFVLFQWLISGSCICQSATICVFVHVCEESVQKQRGNRVGAIFQLQTSTEKHSYLIVRCFDPAHKITFHYITTQLLLLFQLNHCCFPFNHPFKLSIWGTKRKRTGRVTRRPRTSPIFQLRIPK